MGGQFERSVALRPCLRARLGIGVADHRVTHAASPALRMEGALPGYSCREQPHALKVPDRGAVPA